MSTPVQINGVTVGIYPGSLSFSKAVGEVGTGSVVVRSSEIEAQPGQQIRVYDSSGLSSFGGTIESVDITRIAPGNTEVWLKCDFVSWESRLTNRYCGAKVYKSDMNAKARALDILNTYAGNEGLIINGDNFVDGATGEELGTRTYLGMSVMEAWAEIAETSGCVAYVDEGAFCRMVSRVDPLVSDLIFNSTLNNFHEPVVTENRTDYANRVILTIAPEAIAPLVVELTGDGVLQEFEITRDGNPVNIESIVSAELNGVPLSPGIEEVTNNPDAEWTYEFGTGIIKHDTDLPPLGAGDVLRITYRIIGANIVIVEDSDDIDARQAVEDDDVIAASGVYEIAVDDNSILTVEAGIKKAEAILRARCPHKSGAPLGSLPTKYMFKARGYVDHADKIRPGFVIQFQCNVPEVTTKSLLIQSVSAQHMGWEDPSDPGVGGGFLLYTLTCTEFVRGMTTGEYLLSLGGGGSSSSGTSVGGSSGPGGEAGLAGNMTDLHAETRYIWRDGGWVRQLHIWGKRPDPVGTFRGFVPYREEPDTGGATVEASGTDEWDGETSLAGEGPNIAPGPKIVYPDNDAVIILDNLPVNSATTGRVYFNSFNNSDVENTFTPGTSGAATPSVVYTIPPPPNGIGGAGKEYAPVALNFRFEGLEAPDYSNQMGGNHQWSKKFRFDNPVDDPRYPLLSKYQIRIRDGITGQEWHDNEFTKLIQQPIGTKTYAAPKINTLFEVYLLSVDISGNVNSIVPGVTPMLRMLVIPPRGPIGSENAENVRSIVAGVPYYADNADGQRLLRIPGSLTPRLEDEKYAGSVIYLFRPETPGDFQRVAITTREQKDFIAETIAFPLHDEPGCQLVAISINNNNWQNTVILSGTGAAPRSNPFTLPKPPIGLTGKERVDHLPINFRKKNGGAYVNGLKYSLQDGGDWLYGVGVEWDLPDLSTIPRLGFYAIAIKYDNGRLEHFYVDTQQNGWDSDFWPLYASSSGQSFDIYLVPSDPNGRMNGIVDGITPKLTFTPTVPTSGTGVEYGPVVSGFSAQITPTESTVGDELFVFSGTWIVPVPVDPRSGYMVPVAENEGNGDRVPLGVFDIRSGLFRTDPLGVPAGTVWTVWLVPENTNSKRNSIVPGVTPRTTGLVAVGSAPGAGKLKLNKAASSTFNNLEFGFDVSGLLEMKNLVADKMKIGTTLKVGGGPTQKVGQIGAFNATDTMVAWMGQNGADYGLWGANAYFGGNGPSTALAKFEGFVATIKATITMGDPSKSVTISPFAGVEISNSGGLFIRLNDTVNGLQVAGPNGSTNFYYGGMFGGSLTGNTVSLEGTNLSSRMYLSQGGLVKYGFDTSFPATTSAFAGGIPLPAACQGFVQMYVDGSIKKIPYYN